MHGADKNRSVDGAFIRGLAIYANFADNRPMHTDSNPNLGFTLDAAGPSFCIIKIQ